MIDNGPNRRSSRPRSHWTATRVGAVLLAIGAAAPTLACSGESSAPPPTLPPPSTSLAPTPSTSSQLPLAPNTKCGRKDGIPGLGVAYGVVPDQLPDLLSHDGPDDQDTAWKLIDDKVDKIIANEDVPPGTFFVVSADVGYAAISPATAKQRAEDLASLASQYFDFPMGGGPNEPYRAGQDDVATIFVTGLPPSCQPQSS